MENSILIKIKKVINDFIYEQLQVVLEFSDVALETFKYIAFIAVLIKIANNFYNSPNDWWGYISWLPLTFLLFHYDALVMTMFEWSKSMDDQILVTQSYDKVKRFFDNAEIEPEESSMWSIGLTAFTDAIKQALFEGIVMVLLLLGFIISTIMYSWLKIKYFFKLLLLVIFGPLNISLSFIKDFGGNYVSWITKLVEVSTYIPLIYIVDYIGIEMLNKVFSPKVINTAGEAAETLTFQVIGIIFYVGIIALYFSIPSAVKYVITQGGAAIGTGKKVAAVAMLAARKFATGGI